MRPTVVWTVLDWLSPTAAVVYRSRTSRYHTVVGSNASVDRAVRMDFPRRVSNLE